MHTCGLVSHTPFFSASNTNSPAKKIDDRRSPRVIRIELSCSCLHHSVDSHNSATIALKHRNTTRASHAIFVLALPKQDHPSGDKRAEFLMPTHGRLRGGRLRVVPVGPPTRRWEDRVDVHEVQVEDYSEFLICKDGCIFTTTIVCHGKDSICSKERGVWGGDGMKKRREGRVVCDSRRDVVGANAQTCEAA